MYELMHIMMTYNKRIDKSGANNCAVSAKRKKKKAIRKLPASHLGW